jgi:pimeloyl-ACP methyl ester carboxylesterase
MHARAGGQGWIGAASLAVALLASSDRGPATSEFDRKPLPPNGHVVPLRGIRVYYETYGAGPVLVLLHGGAGSGAQFAKQIPYFSGRFRLIVPDACAQGRTTDRPGPLTYHAMAEDVKALLDILHVQHADVMGWSDGGIVGLDLAMRHPALVRHLVTFGANYEPDGLSADDVAWNQTAKPADLGTAVRDAYVQVAPDPSHYDEAMSKVLALWRDEPHYTPEDLGRIRARTLIVAGEHDLVRPEHTESLAAAIPGSMLWIVPGQNHGVMIDDADEVNPRVMAFLRQ